MGSWMPKTVAASRVEQGSNSRSLPTWHNPVSHLYQSLQLPRDDDDDDDDGDSLHVLLVASTRVNIMIVAIIQSSQLLQYLQYKRVT